MTENNPNDEAIGKRQEELKRAVVEQLKETPIIIVACRKSGVSRATYYRWRNEDPEFSVAVNSALKEGIELINDLSESQIIQLIKERKLPAISLWLKHNSPRYGGKSVQRELPPPPDVLTEKEEKLFKEALALSHGRKTKKKYATRNHPRKTANHTTK